MALTFSPITQVQLVFVPAGESLFSFENFGDVKRIYPDFATLRTDFDTFAELNSATQAGPGL